MTSDPIDKENQVALAAYQVGYAQLSRQKEDLRQFRGQAALTLAANGLIATFFSSISGALTKESFTSGFNLIWFNIPSWLLMACITAALIFATLVFVSWRRCEFDLSPSGMIKVGDDEPTIAAFYQRYAKETERCFDDNEKVVSETRFNLLMSMLFTILQIPLWLVFIFAVESTMPQDEKKPAPPPPSLTKPTYREVIKENNLDGRKPSGGKDNDKSD